ncbi:MAG: M50 family metallopeptidase [Candidatus Cellulosilyticum pullistercoris]|uniref:M50 family metallopeptidase n=1 Tax=Candidatus Cellulosilyticum pullistercoris TaxID=2838521 RepID=A0A9E2KBC6_9FIRM|nr:M50 family metallopeptidase [Candidatus Cellulosilyticum pullistercoris]
MLLMVIIFLLMFTVIVVAHEWGHYITAKKCGVLVHEFAVGMGPILWSKQAGETLYSIRLFPIGGFCRMEEEEGESKNPRAMSSKKPWQKLLIVGAGAIMNFILAWVLASILVGYTGVGTNVVATIEPNSPMAESGIVVGDRIIAIDGNKIKNLSDVREMLTSEPKVYTFSIKHDGEKKDVIVTSRIMGDETSPRFGFTVEKSHFNIWQNIKMGFLYMISIIAMVWESLLGLISGAIGFDQMAGIVGVVDVGSKVWDSSMEAGGVNLAIMSMVQMAALLSANLGVVNLLPLPALDGGRIFFILIEMIRGKAIPPEKEGAVHFIGMILLMLLTVVVLYNDIMRLRG